MQQAGNSAICVDTNKGRHTLQRCNGRTALLSHLPRDHLHHHRTHPLANVLCSLPREHAVLYTPTYTHRIAKKKNSTLPPHLTLSSDLSSDERHTINNSDTTQRNPFSRAIGIDAWLELRGQGIKAAVDFAGYAVTKGR